MLDLKRKEERRSRRIMGIELVVFGFLMLAFLMDVPELVLGVFVVACLLVVFASPKSAIRYLAFFTSFAGVFVYDEKHMFFVMVAIFIIKFLLTTKVNKQTIVYYLSIALYCLVFCDYEAEFKFAKILGIILLFAIPVIGSYAHKIDCADVMKHYILGFIVTTIVGFFVMDIPAMLDLFEYDLFWTEENQELTRFFGLAYDSNFYALSNYIIIAYLLFAVKDISKEKIIVIIFLIIAGLQTISKSYLLVLGVLLVVYYVKSITNVRQFIKSFLAIILAGALFVYITDMLGYNVVDLIMGRFVDGSFAENTTGRAELWTETIGTIATSSADKILFGFGFNTEIKDAAHNTYIEFVYKFGLVGTGIWVAYFVHCAKIFHKNTENFSHKSPMVLLSLLVGIFFLSAFTYEAFWIGVMISLMTLTSFKKPDSEVETCTA